MITPQQVREVARTARPQLVASDLEMTIDYVVKYTTVDDWDGALYQLGDTAAAELAAKFNAEHGLTTQRALVGTVEKGRRRGRTAVRQAG